MKQKYTKDGRKVAIIGKLNSTETIVQEVCVKEDGSEIPAGDQFVITGPLLDEPAETWHDKRLRELEKATRTADAKTDECLARMRQTQRRVELHIKSLLSLERKAAPEQLQTMLDFTSGAIKYAVEIGGHGLPTIRPFDDMLERRGEFNHNLSLRLVSLFGKTDGALDWKINSYQDGSGTYRTFIPAKSLEEAIDAAQSVYDDMVNEWRNGDRKCPPKDSWNKMPEEIKIHDDVVNFWIENREKNRLQQIEKLRCQLDELLAETAAVDALEGEE